MISGSSCRGKVSSRPPVLSFARPLVECVLRGKLLQCHREIACEGDVLCQPRAERSRDCGVRMLEQPCDVIARLLHGEPENVAELLGFGRRVQGLRAGATILRTTRGRPRLCADSPARSRRIAEWQTRCRR